jgi:hypothetical protein
MPPLTVSTVAKGSWFFLAPIPLFEYFLLRSFGNSFHNPTKYPYDAFLPLGEGALKTLRIEVVCFVKKVTKDQIPLVLPDCWIQVIFPHISCNLFSVPIDFL